MIRCFVIVAAAALAAAAAHAQTYLGLAPTQNAGAFRAQAGQALSFVCPASDGGKAKLYGTDTYTDDSAICAAAIHAGVLKAGRAGVVTILIGDGAKSFTGSERNRIVSHDYGAWEHSYSFVHDDEPGSITWKTVWNGVPDDFTDPIVVNCPSGGDASKTIWGTRRVHPRLDDLRCGRTHGHDHAREGWARHGAPCARPQGVPGDAALPCHVAALGIVRGRVQRRGRERVGAAPAATATAQQPVARNHACGLHGGRLGKPGRPDCFAHDCARRIHRSRFRAFAGAHPITHDPGAGMDRRRFGTLRRQT